MPKLMPSDAQHAYRFTGPKATRRRGAAPFGVSSDTIAKLQALAAAGHLDGLLPKRRGAGARAAGFDITELLKLYAQYRPIIDMLLPLLQGLFKKDAKPVVVTDPARPVDPDDPGIDDPDDVDEPAGNRVPKRLDSKVFWVARKNTPQKAQGGRYLLNDEAKAKAGGKDDPLQMGDRVCFDDTPYDQNGVKFEGEKPLILEHIVGGVGEIQQQEENDYTPVVFVPWEGEVKPGFQGEITYQVKGGGLAGPKHVLRVRPWAEGPRGTARVGGPRGGKKAKGRKRAA